MKQRFTSRVAPAVVAVLILAACGGDSDVGNAPLDTPTDRVTSTTDPVDGSGLRAPTPVEVVGGSSASTSGVASAEAGSVTADAPAIDMAIAPWVVEYVVGDGLPALPTDDTGYVFDATADVTAEHVAAIASAFGVAGEPIRVDEGYGVSWRVGPDDGSGPGIWVNDDGQQGWSYNAPWADVPAAEACAVSIDPDGNEVGDCPEPEPPAGVPSAEQAEQRARELLAALGADVSTLSFESSGDEWFAGVEVSDGIDNRAAVRTWSFGFGGEGVLQYAWGSLAAPAPVGPYPLVDLPTAVARLSDGFYGGFGGVAVAEPDLAVVSGVAEETVSVEGDIAKEEEPVDEPVDPPEEQMPTEPLPGGEPVVITLVDVTADLWWAWDGDGSAWLLPAYRFIDADGGWHVVPAVTDEFLVRAEPVGDTPLPAPEPLPAPAPEPDTPEPVMPEPDTSDPDVPPPDVPDAVDVEPGTDPEVAMSVLEEYVGLSIEEFTAEAQGLGFTTRIVVQDGEGLAVTADYSPTRVNVEVEGPRVVAINSIG